jgi:hypothetical protein
MAAPRTEVLFAAVGRRPVRTLSLLFAVCVATFLITIPVPRRDHLLIGSDGVRYYCHVHSLVIDGDLDFRDEYIHFHGPARVPADTPAGYPPNKMSIGLGLVWIPFFVAAHALSALLGLPTDGYSYVYQAAVCLGSMMYGFIGLLLTYRLCRERVDAASATVAVVLIWFASNVLYYMVVEPSMSHMASLGAVSALLAWWRLRHDRTSLRYWTGLGALGGLAALIRPQDGLFLLLPGMQWAIEASHLVRSGRRNLLAAHAARGAATAATAALLFTIQLWAWQVVFGSVRASGYFYSGHEGFNWWHPHVIDVLFSPFHGFFTWHPIYLVGAVGLWWIAKADRLYGALLVLGVLVQVYLVAAWRIWWQGEAFGGRMLISTVPILALGLAEVVARLRRISGWAVILPSVALLLWNFAFLVQYRFGFIPMDQPISVRQLVWEKFTLPFDLWHRFGR